MKQVQKVKKIELFMAKQDAEEYLEFLKSKGRVEDISTIAELQIFIERFEKEEGERKK